MSGDRIRLSPVVAGLVLANAVVGVLLATVLTLPAIPEVLRFDPGLVVQRPWTLLTYMFVQPNLVLLGINLLLLVGFGPQVERKSTGSSFLLYYLACGIGSALYALGLTSFLAVSPLQGPTGAVLGVAVAFWFAWPNARLVLDPLPIRPRVGTLLACLAGIEIAAAVLLKNGPSHLANLGGLITGYLIVRINMIRAKQRRTPPAPLPLKPVMTSVSARQSARPVTVRPAPTPEPPPESHPVEDLDRLLDKISASGMESLTAEERSLLHRLSERKRKDSS